MVEEDSQPAQDIEEAASYRAKADSSNQALNTGKSHLGRSDATTMASGENAETTLKGVATKVLLEFNDDLKNAIAQRLYYEELETIRRKEPLLVTKIPVHDVKVLKVGKKKKDPAPAPKETAPEGVKEGAAPAAAETAVVELLSSPEPPSSQEKAAASSSSPAGLAQDTKKGPDHGYADKKTTTRRYHDMTAGAGQWPGPKAGLRFDVATFRRDHGWGDADNQDLGGGYPRELAAATADTYVSHLADQEASVNGLQWAAGGDAPLGPEYPFLRGFPLVEEVVFLRGRNHWGSVSTGACYWSALAMHIYGDPYAWLRVKAEHVAHFGRVLRESRNPRHGLYRELNEKWYETMGSVGRKSGSSSSQGNFDANLWQILHLPGVYVPMNMLDVTADLYNVFLVVYSYDHGVVYETRTRGAYNSRHLFLLYVNGNHFQPLITNDFLHWEFKLPRVTLQSTKGLPLAASKNDGVKHPWRSELRSAGGQKAPLLINRPWDAEAAAAAVSIKKGAIPAGGGKKKAAPAEGDKKATLAPKPGMAFPGIGPKSEAPAAPAAAPGQQQEADPALVPVDLSVFFEPSPQFPGYRIVENSEQASKQGGAFPGFLRGGAALSPGLAPAGAAPVSTLGEAFPDFGRSGVKRGVEGEEEEGAPAAKKSKVVEEEQTAVGGDGKEEETQAQEPEKAEEK